MFDKKSLTLLFRKVLSPCGFISSGFYKMETNEEEILKRHKQEKKELHAKVLSLKKSVPKGDKKRKNEITEEIAKLEKDLDCKHRAELAEIRGNNDENATSPIDEVISSNDRQIQPNEEENDQFEPKITRAQKRRNKKAQEQKEREQRILEQAEKNKEGPRIIEMNAIKEALSKMGLQIYNIPADGNCLYCAINHQLETTERESFNVTKLRKITAEYMRNNKDDFLPFLYSDGVVVEDYFDNYCKEVEKTKLWGGQLELKALSSALKCPIKVIQATGPPTLLGESYQGPELILTYHRHLYRLGEHYNSTRPVDDEGDE